MNQTQTSKMPKGVYYIIGNEAAERFSYYGMRTILVMFMTKYLLDSQSQPNYMSEEEAKTWYHTFMSAVYFFPLFGALLSDIFLGKYKTIISLSIVYCLGHLSLAFMDIGLMTQILEPKMWLALGLGLIAIGSGGIKPCVSAHVGDQFDQSKKDLLDKVFGYFYFAINFGSFFSTLATPWLLKAYGPGIAFGIPGLLMFVATFVFYLGRKEFIAMPAAGWTNYKKELFGPEGLKSMLSLSVIYFFIAFFWALYEQTGSSWVLQADKMNRFVNLGFVTFELDAAQIQAINPILVMLFIPLFTLIIYPLAEKYIKITALGKISLGFFVTALSFALVAITESWIQAGQTPSMLWQFLAYVIITAAEVLIYMTALEFSYTQAPNSMKSIMMAFFLLSVSLGNLITAGVNSFIQRPDGTVLLQGASYYWFFTILISVAGFIFIFASKFYKEKTYLQDHKLAEES
jgi:proton-dependent oligopeptide transporter, POT family